TQEALGGLQNGWTYTPQGELGTYTWGSATGPAGASNPNTTVVRPAVLQGLLAAVACPAVVTATAAQPKTTARHLADQGRALLQTAADGGQTAYSSTNGFMSTVTDPLGRTTAYARDDAFYVTQATDADGNTYQYRYQPDFHGLVIGIEKGS